MTLLPSTTTPLPPTTRQTRDQTRETGAAAAAAAVVSPLSFPGVTFGCQITRVGIELPANLEIEDWLTVVKEVVKARDAYRFAIGDVLNFGEHRYSEKYSQALEDTGIDYGSMRNYCYVAERVRFALRNDNLSWSHHYAIARLDPVLQQYWLLVAERNKMTVAELRTAIENAHPRPVKEDSQRIPPHEPDAPATDPDADPSISDIDPLTAEEEAEHRNAADLWEGFAGGGELPAHLKRDIPVTETYITLTSLLLLSFSEDERKQLLGNIWRHRGISFGPACEESAALTLSPCLFCGRPLP